MVEYEIVRRKVDDGWQVWWNGELVYEDLTDRARWNSHKFANDLEMHLTGSDEPLYANSKIQIEGWMDYLEAFDTYEDYAR